MREDNEWMQYRQEFKSEEDVKEYWSKPFSVKPEMGFYTWTKDKVKLRVVDDTPNKIPDYFGQIILNFFSQEANLSLFIERHSIEHKKGEDFFSMDNAYFFCMLFECLGIQLLKMFLPHLQKLAESEQESEQRAASEIVYGVIRGSRFWSFEDSKIVSQELSSLMRAVLSRMSLETIGDWEAMLNGATNKIDPNRIR